MRYISFKVLAAATLVTVAVLINPAAQAVGLGPVQVDSRLNQPLRAEILLLSVGDIDPEKISATLASPEDFERVGLDMPGVLNELSFSIEDSDSGPVIRVSSQAPIREPFLSFLLRLDWPQGRLLREYTVLLDPPVLAPAAAPEPERGPARTPDVRAEPVSEPEPEPERQPEVSRPAVSGGEYGPVASGETLWRIANSTRPADVSINQMMLALLRTNPDAFFENNINALKRGAVLRVPGRREIESLSASEAVRAVQSQNDLWQDYRRNLAESAPAVVEGGEGPARAPATTEEPEAESRLELVPPRQADESAAEAVAGPGEPGGADVERDASELQAELARAREALLAEEQEGEQLTGRVQELEDQVDRLQRLLEMKNEELASLQAQEPGATQADRPVDEMTFDDEPVAGPEEGQGPSPEEETAAGESVEAAGPQEDEPQEPAVSEPPSAPERAGWLEWLLSPIVVGILGLLLIGIGIALFLHRRRESEARTTLQRESLEVGRTSQRTSERAEVAVAEEESAKTGPPEAGPADYDAGALRAALDENPADTQTRLKLLRHYAARQQADEFVAEAETLYAQLANPTDPAWIEARALGEEVAPDNPLFGGDGDIRSSMGEDDATDDDWSVPPEPQTPREEPPTPREEVESGEREPRDELGDLEFEPPEAPAEPEEPSGEYSVEDLDTGEEDRSFDFEPGADEGAAPEREDSPAGPTEEEPSADEGLDLGEMAEPRREADETPDVPQGEDAEAGPGSDKRAVPAPSGGEDAVQTKLDLAEAYVDMSDEEGARDLLDEVMKEGDESQQARARELLDKLGK